MHEFLQKLNCLDVKFNNKSSRFPRFGKSDPAKSNDYNDTICNLIDELILSNIAIDSVLDLACGHGNHLMTVHEKFKNLCIGVDIHEFDAWNHEFENLHFFQKDIDEITTNIKCKEKLDLIITMNTLRSSPFRTKKYFTLFLEWCRSHSNYLITNNCTNVKLPGFELIATKTPDGTLKHRPCDVNLFKTL